MTAKPSPVGDPESGPGLIAEPSWLQVTGAGLWVGLMGGALEVATTLTKKHLLQQPVWLGWPVLWMAPLVGGVVAALAAVVGWAGLRWLPRHRVLPLVSWSVVFLTAWSLVLVVLPDIQEYARVVLAAGLAVQGARAVSRHPRLVPRTARRVPGLLLLLAVIAAAPPLALRVVERNRLSRLPEVQAGAPNVLLVTIDTERAASLELYGGATGTSAVLSRLGREGAVFERAIATSPWTLPSHASLFTGYYAHEMSANWLRPLDRSYPTLAERFAAVGYLTAGFVANTFYCNHEFGLERGFLHYEDYVTSLEEMVLSHGLTRRIANSATLRQTIDFEDIIARRTADQVNHAFLTWLDRRDDRPFFAFLNYFEPHVPYAPPLAYRQRFGAVRLREYLRAEHELRVTWIPDDRRQWASDSTILAAQRAYHGTIASADASLGTLVAELGRRGVLDQTLLIVTSDHGEQFGEHRHPTRPQRLFTHGNSLYMQALWVPLVIRFPSMVPAGVRIRTPVSLRDIPATIAALSGVLEPDAFPGVSLGTLWEKGAARQRPSPTLSSVIPYDRRDDPRAWIASLGSDRYHYVRHGTGRVELFDLFADPAETSNLAAQPDSLASHVVRSLEAELERALRDWTPRHLGPRD